jgi:hypothetical protein
MCVPYVMIEVARLPRPYGYVILSVSEESMYLHFPLLKRGGRGSSLIIIIKYIHPVSPSDCHPSRGEF